MEFIFLRNQKFSSNRRIIRFEWAISHLVTLNAWKAYSNNYIYLYYFNIIIQILPCIIEFRCALIAFLCMFQVGGVGSQIIAYFSFDVFLSSYIICTADPQLVVSHEFELIIYNKYISLHWKIPVTKMTVSSSPLPLFDFFYSSNDKLLTVELFWQRQIPELSLRYLRH